MMVWNCPLAQVLSVPGQLPLNMRHKGSVFPVGLNPAPVGQFAQPPDGGGGPDPGAQTLLPSAEHVVHSEAWLHSHMFEVALQASVPLHCVAPVPHGSPAHPGPTVAGHMWSVPQVWPSEHALTVPSPEEGTQQGFVGSPQARQEKPDIFSIGAEGRLCYGDSFRFKDTGMPRV